MNWVKISCVALTLFTVTLEPAHVSAEEPTIGETAVEPTPDELRATVRAAIEELVAIPVDDKHTTDIARKVTEFEDALVDAADDGETLRMLHARVTRYAHEVAKHSPSVTDPE